MKSGREKAIFKMLKSDEFITSSTIANELHLSERTIQTLIKQMNEDKVLYGAEIISKKRYGYCLNVFDLKQYQCYLKFSDDFDKEDIPNSQNERILYVAMYLLFHNQYVKLDELCEKLYVSKSTIANVIRSVKKIFIKYQIEIDAKPNYGLKIICDELSRRRCIVDCLKKHQELKPDDLEIGSIIQNILDDVFTKECFQISAVSRNSLVLHLCIAVKRIKKGYYLDRNYKFVLYDEENLRISKIITHKLERKLQINIPDKEIDYIAIQLACKQIVDKENSKQNLVFTQQILDIVEDMINQVEEAFHIDFKNDLELQMNLCQHMVPLKIRLEYGFIAENPLLEDIKKEYPLAYEMATLASSVMYEQYLRKMSEDEIGYIAMTFALALEKRKSNRKKNVLLVCGTGRGSAKLLQLKVEKHFKDMIDHVYTCDVHQILEIDFYHIDYVFTTVSIPSKIPVPIVEMPAFLNEDNVYEIKQRIETNKKIFFQQYFHKKLFFVHLKYNEKIDVLKFLCKQAVDQGFSKEGLFDLVLKREILGKTAFGNFVAMPHPTKSSSLDTYVCVGILDNPIDWDGTPVQIIFLISIVCSSSQQLDNFYKGITRLFRNRKQIQRLIQNQDYQTLQNVVKNIEEYKE